MNGRRSTAVVMGLVVAMVAAMSLCAPPASAERTTAWATWGPLAGGSNAYRTTMQIPLQGFPVASVASDSRSQAQIPSGASTFLGGAGDAVETPPGVKYGSSRNQPYLNLRPKADSLTAPSTTTYTFDRPTPDVGWAFVLGDIDADQVAISAKDEDGTAISAAQIGAWFQGTFNYVGDADVPIWDPGTSTLTGNPAALDTNGASAWFEPVQRLSSLTFTYTRRAGFPVYQTWFAGVARTISGTVDDVSNPGSSCPIEQSVLTLVGPFGDVLATTSPSSTGAYAFGQYATQDGYRVRLTAPAGCAITTDSQLDVSTAASDATADFDVRAIIPQPISGVVTAESGPVPGVEVTLTYPDGVTTVTTTTDSNGAYLFDNNAIGAGYTVSVSTLPDGFDLDSPTGGAYTGIEVASSPITDRDFTLVERPDVSGTVQGGGAGVGGVTVALTPQGGGAPITTTTLGDGAYTFEHVPAGVYDISVEPTDGFSPVPPREGVVVSGTDVTDQDFAFARPGALGGTVTESSTGDPIAGAAVTIDGPGGTQTLTTDAAGAYFLDQLPAGSYTIVLTAPDGTTASGPTTLSAVITEAGEIRGGLDFAVTAQTEPTDEPTGPSGDPTEPAGTPAGAEPATISPAASPTTTLAPAAGTASGSPTSGGALASTGADARSSALLALALLLAGLAATAGAGAARAARRRR